MWATSSLKTAQFKCNHMTGRLTSNALTVLLTKRQWRIKLTLAWHSGLCRTRKVSQHEWTQSQRSGTELFHQVLRDLSPGKQIHDDFLCRNTTLEQEERQYFKKKRKRNYTVHDFGYNWVLGLVIDFSGQKAIPCQFHFLKSIYVSKFSHSSFTNVTLKQRLSVLLTISLLELLKVQLQQIKDTRVQLTGDLKQVYTGIICGPLCFLSCLI